MTRAKDNMQVRCVKKCLEKSRGPILRDDWVVLTAVKSKGKYPHFFCRIIAQVEVNGKLVEMTFITNNLEWSAGSICDLYKARWAIESFFKQIKQVLQICDFFGHSCNTMASLDGLISLCFTALPELFESMAPQFCAYFYGVALGIVEPISAVHFIEKLWDSRWFLSDALRTSTSLERFTIEVSRCSTKKTSRLPRREKPLRTLV